MTVSKLHNALVKFMDENPLNGDVQILVAPDDTKVSNLYDGSALLTGSQAIIRGDRGDSYLLLSHE